MLMKRGLAAVATLVFFLSALIPNSSMACGHDGIYLGLGYTQEFMYTTQNRIVGAGSGDKIYFSPGFGGNALIGYDFCGSRWGIQAPFEFARLKLNRLEWVNQFGSSFEGVFHIVEWPNGIDIHVTGGAGWSYITEGNVQNASAAGGVTASIGPGFSWYFIRTEKISAAAVLEVPLRMVHYFGDHLSRGGTTIFAIPIRISAQIGF